MLSPTSIMAETDRLNALLEILRNPEQYKKQIDELRQLSKDTEDKVGKLVDQTVEYQNIKNEVTELVSDHQNAVDGLRGIMDQASKMVEDANSYRAHVNVEVTESVREAKRLVDQILEASDKQKEILAEKVAEQENRIVQLDKDIAARGAKLADIENRLAVIRESMGG